MRRIMLGLLLLPAILISILLLAPTAHAATFTVTTTGDESAVNPALGCEIGGGADCTLRSSIEAANAIAGADIINFNIPGAGLQTLTPASDYPVIIDQVTIDGSTQPGAQCGTLVPSSLPGSNTPHTLLIEIDASSTTGSTLTFQPNAGSSIVKGLILNNAATNNSSIAVAGVDNVTIECNYIGTDSTGETSHTSSASVGIVSFFSANTIIQNNLISGFGADADSYGIFANGSGKNINNNLIGTNASGVTALPNTIGISLVDTNDQADASLINHNIISGNSGVGLQNGVITYGGTNMSVIGNYIGVNITGSALGNGGDGIYMIGASNSTIGGNSATNRNVIAANTGNGIHIFSQGDDGSGCNVSSGNTVVGNYIGTNTSGSVTDGFGNHESGIAVNEITTNCSHGSIYQNILGGDSAGQPNTIAGNTLDGIRMYQVPNTPTDVFSISVLPNVIYSNGNLGINLAEDSTGTGTADTDLGPNLLNNYLMSYPSLYANNYLNRPVISATTFSGNQATVNYNFDANQADESTLFQADVIGYRLDFYLNDAGKDGAYDGYSQGKTHLGSFIVNGSEANASHTFVSPVTPVAGQSVTATATVLWKVISIDECNVSSSYWGSGPPYSSCP